MRSMRTTVCTRGCEPINRLLYVDAHTYLPDDILALTDRMSMAVSLEARTPFLDYRLVECSSSLRHWQQPDESSRMDSGQTSSSHEARMAFRLADAVLPVSESLRASMESHGIRAAFRVIPNPVDTSVFRPGLSRSVSDSRRRRILFVGRLMPVKGVDVLLEGLSRLAKTRSDLRVDVIGDGAHRPAYESMARRLGLDGIVMFRGFQPREVAAEDLRRADVLVLPSRSENSRPVIFGIQ